MLAFAPATEEAFGSVVWNFYYEKVDGFGDRRVARLGPLMSNWLCRGTCLLKSMTKKMSYDTAQRSHTYSVVGADV
jgi:hypothetical protein